MTRNQVRSVTDAVGSIDMPDAEDEAPESKKKTRKGGKRGKKGPLGRLALFYRQIVAELRKVVWPTRSQLSTYTAVVIVFVVVMIGLVTVIDFGFARVIKYVFGCSPRRAPHRRPFRMFHPYVSRKKQPSCLTRT